MHTSERQNKKYIFYQDFSYQYHRSSCVITEMNYAELSHSPIFHSLMESQAHNSHIPHYPVFTLQENKNVWHFFSAQGLTLRKKLENASISKFLTPSNDYTLIEIRQMHKDRFTESELFPIKSLAIKRKDIKNFRNLTVPSEVKCEQIMLKQNNWRPKDGEKIFLIRIDDFDSQKLHSLNWSESLITSDAPLSTKMKEKLTNLGQILKKMVQQIYFKEEDKIREFELVFSYDSKEGKIRIAFLHNFRLKNETANIFGWKTDFKVGKDQYEKIELAIEDKKREEKDLNSEEYFEMKRIQYLKFLRRINGNTHSIQKPQIDQEEKIVKEFQCSSCHCLVALNENECQKIVPCNRVPQIQLLRQVKMRKIVQKYDLVPVCETCYSKFLEITTMNKNRISPAEKCQENRKQIQNILPICNEKERIVPSIPYIPKPKPNHKPHNTDTTITTRTIKISSEVGDAVPHNRKRVASLQREKTLDQVKKDRSFRPDSAKVKQKSIPVTELSERKNRAKVGKSFQDETQDFERRKQVKETYSELTNALSEYESNGHRRQAYKLRARRCYLN